jgi:4-hydroxy-tetrahydrodipicolinate synthase
MAIEGILPVIPTPFRDGRFDEASFQRMLDHMLPSVDGYTLLGSTGEAPSLPTDERVRIAEAALAMTPPEKTVVVGVTHTSAAESVRLALHAQEHGAAGVLCAAPYYFTNSSGGIQRYLEELDRILEVELVLYDNPVSTKTRLDAEQVVGYAAALAHLNTVKLTDHDLTKVARWQAAGLRVLAGDDPILFRYLDAGVDGVMVIAPVLFPAAFRRVWELARAGEVRTALAAFASEVLPTLHVFGIGDEIVTTKVLLAQMRVFDSDEVLPPLEPTDERRRALLAAALEVSFEAQSHAPSS